MYLKQLETFLSVAETGSFVRTAERLYLSQPAVTQQIQNLENELGFPLLLRSKRRVELTPEGEHFLTGARRIVEIYRDTLKECLQLAGGTTECTIHYVGNINLQYLPKLLQELQAQLPDCHILTQRTRPDLAAELLYNGVSRLLLAPEDLIHGFDGIVFQPLYPAGYYVVVSPSHPLAQYPKLTIDQLDGSTFLVPNESICPQHMRALIKELETALPHIQKIATRGMDDTFVQLAWSQGVAIMPEYTCPRHPDLVSVPLILDKTVSYGVAYRPPLTLAESRLVELLPSFFQI